MINAEVDYTYQVEEWGTHVVNGAANLEDAKQTTLDYIRETFPHALNVQVEDAREIRDAA
jgi:hypothetical protein